MELACVRIAYHTLDKISPVLFSPLEPRGEIGENLPLEKIPSYTVCLSVLQIHPQLVFTLSGGASLNSYYTNSCEESKLLRGML